MVPGILLHLLLLPVTPISTTLGISPLPFNESLLQTSVPGIMAINHSVPGADHPNKAWIQTMFKDVVENMNTSKQSYEAYFSPKYVQHTNGRLRRYTAFVSHMQAEKAHMQRIRVKFDQIVAQDNSIATIHVVTATRPDGTKVRARVLAFFTLENNKIISCDEVTQPM